MSFVAALFLGLLQGVAEFLPISSSGHLALAEHFLGLGETPRFFDVMLHVGTLAAVLFFYRAWVLAMIGALLSGGPTPALDAGGEPTHEGFGSARRLTLFVILATIPAVLAGGLFRPTKNLAPGELPPVGVPWREQIGNLREHSARTPKLVAVFLSVTGVVLVVASIVGRTTTGRFAFRWHDALAMGFAQALSAVFPGLSRSGMTVSTAMLVGVRGSTGVHFSLLMGIPAIAGALVLKLRDLDAAWLTPANLIATAAGTLVSAVVGYGCILLLAGAVRRNLWWVFAPWVWLVSLAGFIFG